MKKLEESGWQFSQISEVASQIAHEEKAVEILPRLLAFAQTSNLVDAFWCNQTWISSNLFDQHPKLESPPESLSTQTKTFQATAPFTDPKLKKKGCAWLNSTPYKSITFVPINFNNQRLFAQIVLFSKSEAGFPAEFLDVIQHLAEITTLALSRSWLFRERIAIHEFSQNMAHAISPDDAIRITLSLLTEALSLNHSQIFIPVQDAGIQVYESNARTKFVHPDPLRQWELVASPKLIIKSSADASKFLPFDVDQENVEELFVFPLFGQKTIKGTVCIGHATVGREFVGEEIEFANLVIDLLNTTLENLSLFDELIRRAQELISLNQISEKISGTLNNRDLAQIVYGEISNLTPCDLFLLALVETGSRFVQPLLMVEDGKESELEPIPLQENSDFFWAIHDLETILIEQDDPLMQSIWEMVSASADHADPPENCILSPMAHGTIGYGVMVIFAKPDRPFSPDDIQIVRAVSHQAALGLANSALLQAEQNHVSELRSLSNVTRAMATGITSQERITGMIRTLHTSLNRGNISVLMVDSGGALTIVGSQGTPPTLPKQGQFYNSMIGRALLEHTTQFQPDLRQLPDDEKIGSEHIQSQISVPILIAGEVAGVLNADHAEPNSFTDNDLRLLQSVSLSLGSMLENGRLFREIQDANKRLKALDELKTRFLANMSHELRTPLNSIIGFSRIMMKGMDGPVTKEQYMDLESIYNSGQHLLSLINDILDLAKLEAGKMGMVFDDIDIVDLANSVIATARGLVHDQNVELIVDIHPDARFIEADNIRLRQVLLNLLSNAAKFTYNGTIVLSTRPGETADMVIISVEDSGSGIEPETLPRIFDIFEQGRNSLYPEAAGTGLGLSIVRELVHLHRGRVLVESEIDKGSTFHIHIPRSQPEQLDDGPDIRAQDHGSNGKSSEPDESAETPINGALPKAILLVDDDPVIAKLYHRFLENMPVELICVSNGVDAITMLETHQYEIVLVILDVHMPEMSGWETVEFMNEKGMALETPLAISSVEPDFGKAARLGVKHVLPKPVRMGDLDKLFKEIRLSVPSISGGD